MLRQFQFAKFGSAIVAAVALVAASALVGCGGGNAGKGGSQGAQGGKAPVPGAQPGAQAGQNGGPTGMQPGVQPGQKLAPGAQPGMPGGTGGMRMGMGRGLSAANVPTSVLKDTLKLTSAQVKQIDAIKQESMQQGGKLFAGRRPGEGQPGPQDLEKIRAQVQKLREQAESRVVAVLTDEQKKALPVVLKDVGDLSMVGIPVELYSQLKLTDAQKKAIAAQAASVGNGMSRSPTPGQRPGDPRAFGEAQRAARNKVKAAAMKTLTASQRALVTKYEKAHPRSGGRFGFGGPGSGGPGPQMPGGPPPREGGAPPDR